VAEVPPRRESLKLGRVLGAHGVRGWLKIQSHTEPPENLLHYRVWTLCDAAGERASFELQDAEFDGRWLRARLQGVEDRDAAELLRGRDIEVPRADLPPTAAREYYRDDLLGFRVRNRAGAELGELSHYVEAPAAPVMVVRGAREHWVPAAPPHLVRVDLERGEIEVDWPEEL
jgi:16S rRNA processing protein RimM